MSFVRHVSLHAEPFSLAVMVTVNGLARSSVAQSSLKHSSFPALTCSPAAFVYVAVTSRVMASGRSSWPLRHTFCRVRSTVLQPSLPHGSWPSSGSGVSPPLLSVTVASSMSTALAGDW